METIVAISTAPAIGGIGIIRISGKDCYKIIDKIFIPKNKEKKEIKGYTIKYGNIIDPNDNKIIDEVLVSFFREPKSYTTEDMCEINSHGGIIILRKILNICLENGAKLAEPGEFTKRAFLNGRIDLTQAEAVIDIINSKTTKEAETSVNQLEGYLSEKIKNIRKKIIDLMVKIEVSIDYPEYDVEEVIYSDAIEEINSSIEDLEKLEKSFENGKIIKDGIKLAIIGSPNAGKSSLLNEILKEERAIVTDIAGTTRDIIEEQIIIKGIPFKIIDTAGIRDTDNKIEKIGIEKSKKAANESDVVIAMFDNSKELSKEDKEILKFIKDKQAIIVLNKIDLESKNIKEKDEIKKADKEIIEISLKRKDELNTLFESLAEMYNLNKITLDSEIIVTNERHKNLIMESKKYLQKAKQDLEKNMPVDVATIAIKSALEELGKITGDEVSEDIIKEIFSKFCLGK